MLNPLSRDALTSRIFPAARVAGTLSFNEHARKVGLHEMDIVWQAEDSLREKKVESDLKDLLKTLVAFANSVGPNDTAQIFIGERDDGTVQGVTNADNIQKTIRNECDKIYPEIYYRTEVYEREGKQCVRVDIKQNKLAPHFAGPAWVRKGSETIKATPQLYQEMVELRQSKVWTLSQWLNRRITVTGTLPEMTGMPQIYPAMWTVIDRWFGYHEATLLVVNPYWVTVRVQVWPDGHGGNTDRSEPMERLLLTWDHEKDRLKVLVKHASDVPFPEPPLMGQR